MPSTAAKTPILPKDRADKALRLLNQAIVALYVPKPVRLGVDPEFREINDDLEALYTKLLRLSFEMENREATPCGNRGCTHQEVADAR